MILIMTFLFYAKIMLFTYFLPNQSFVLFYVVV